MNDKTAFPLAWPDRWPRVPRHQRRDSPFKRSMQYAARRHSMDEACRGLANELDRLKATEAILSTNVRRRLDGQPVSSAAQPADVGAAVYFKLKGREVSLACDKWLRVEDNIWAIVKHIEAIRGQDRWGVGSVEQSFRGYMALPAPGQGSGLQWWKVLGLPINATREQVRDAYRLLAMKHHPDKAGDPEMFLRVREAWDQFNAAQPAWGK